jgi:hypothetical protein
VEGGRKPQGTRRRLETAIGVDPEFLRRHIFEREANAFGNILRGLDVKRFLIDQAGAEFFDIDMTRRYSILSPPG